MKSPDTKEFADECRKRELYLYFQIFYLTNNSPKNKLNDKGRKVNPV